MTALSDEDFIDIEPTSPSSTILCSNSPPQNREFEFQMSASISNERDNSVSPADDLFYKGKLLPLHLPPRLEMVQKLLHIKDEIFEDCGVPFLNSPSTNGCCTPVDSCNISPSESCRVSCELNPSEYFFSWSTDEFRSFIHDHHPKKSWSKKLKLIKQPSFLTQKLKNSRTYLKSLFTKSNCSMVSSSLAENREKAEQGADKLNMVPKKVHSGNLCNMDDNISKPRKSFSGAIKRHSPSKCLSSSSSSDSSSSGASSLSSSFSINSNGVFDLHLMKRSRSDPSVIETSIEAAIAHCKHSQKLFN